MSEKRGGESNEDENENDLHVGNSHSTVCSHEPGAQVQYLWKCNNRFQLCVFGAAMVLPGMAGTIVGVVGL